MVARPCCCCAGTTSAPRWSGPVTSITWTPSTPALGLTRIGPAARRCHCWSRPSSRLPDQSKRLHRATPVSRRSRHRRRYPDMPHRRTSPIIGHPRRGDWRPKTRSSIRICKPEDGARQAPAERCLPAPPKTGLDRQAGHAPALPGRPALVTNNHRPSWPDDVSLSIPGCGHDQHPVVRQMSSRSSPRAETGYSTSGNSSRRGLSIAARLTQKWHESKPDRDPVQRCTGLSEPAAPSASAASLPVAVLRAGRRAGRRRAGRAGPPDVRAELRPPQRVHHERVKALLPKAPASAPAEADPERIAPMRLTQRASTRDVDAIRTRL